ncbi:hypothetical protein [Pectinatus frisingensis]|uniref:hypothetical protein n=1 Tax=Pectinatus frisingensis TaxID=865 RepID=UPI003D804483
MEPQKGLTKIENNIIEAEGNSCIQILKAVIAQIPFAGGLISLWDNYVKSIEEKNILIYIEDIVDRKLIEKLEEIKTDKKEWDILLKHASVKILRCTKEGQIHRIIDILEGKFDGKISSFDDAEDLINIVGELSENEACQLRQIYLMFNAKDQKNTTDIIYLNKLRGNNCEFLCSRLVGKGLLADASLSYSAPHKSYQPPNITGEKLYKATHMGDCLFKSLKLFRE